jgi:hypothetical protein
LRLWDNIATPYILVTISPESLLWALFLRLLGVIEIESTQFAHLPLKRCLDLEGCGQLGFILYLYAGAAGGRGVNTVIWLFLEDACSAYDEQVGWVFEGQCLNNLLFFRIIINEHRQS